MNPLHWDPVSRSPAKVSGAVGSGLGWTGLVWAGLGRSGLGEMCCVHRPASWYPMWDVGVIYNGAAPFLHCRAALLPVCVHLSVCLCVWYFVLVVFCYIQLQIMLPSVGQWKHRGTIVLTCTVETFCWDSSISREHIGFISKIVSQYIAAYFS